MSCLPDTHLSSPGHLQLKTVLEKVLALPGAEKPLVALFFRRQMVTIISRALRELDIVPLSSQRCFSLMGRLLPCRCLSTRVVFATKA